MYFEIIFFLKKIFVVDHQKNWWHTYKHPYRYFSSTFQQTVNGSKTKIHSLDKGINPLQKYHPLFLPSPPTPPPQIWKLSKTSLFKQFLPIYWFFRNPPSLPTNIGFFSESPTISKMLILNPISSFKSNWILI